LNEKIMTDIHPTLSDLRPNPAWASLPLFDRTGWKRVRFGDVVENCAETCNPEEAGLERFVAMEHLEPGSLHVRSWGNVSDGTTFTRRCRPGQVLFGKRRAYQRKVAVAEFEAVVSGDIYVLAPKDDRLLPELLPFLCLSERFFQHAVGTSAGSLSPRTNWSSLASFEFDLPPLDQQRRIAEILWAVDASLGANDGLESSLLEYRQALLDSIALEYSESHALAPLDSAIEQGRPICYGILMPGLGVGNGIPVVKVRDFPDGYIREGDLLQTTAEIEAPYKRSRLKSGDLLISIRGTIGRMAEVPPSLDGANITQDTARLSIAPEHNRGYLRAVLESRFVERQIQSRITGLAVKGINIGELRQIQIPLPSRPKQDEIAEKLSAISTAQKAAAANSVQVRSVMAASIENLLGGYSR
jgi:type I restriction enzyme S subunit